MRYNSGYAANGITGDPSPSEADIRLTRRTVQRRVQQARQTMAAQGLVTQQRGAAFAANEPRFVFGGHGASCAKVMLSTPQCRPEATQFLLDLGGC
jgi:hypothetical protein